MAYWIRARFRDDRVWARCDGSGSLKPGKGGYVPFRYKRGGRSYRTRPERLEVEAGAEPEELDAGTRSPERRGGPGALPTGEAPRSEQEVVQLWTDGSCHGNPGPAGLGVVYRHGGEVRERKAYLGHATNNVAELTAILRAVEEVADPATPVDVMTDSGYAVGLLTQGWKPKANRELVERLRGALQPFRDLRLVKVAGHAGVADNERADWLANRAIEEAGAT